MICNAEADSVESVAQQWSDTVDTYGVAWAGDDASFQDFIDRHGLSFDQLDDRDGHLYEAFGIVAQPAFVIIDADGETTTLLGALDHATLDAALAQAVASTPAVTEAPT